MNDRRQAVLGGISALGKSVLLVLGVPAAIVRLWALAPQIHRPITLGTITTTGGWVHCILVGVGVLWTWASVTLVRQIVTALRSRGGAGSTTWSRRWAGGVAGLVLTLATGSAVSTVVAFRARPAVVQTVPRSFSDAARVNVPTQQSVVEAVGVGECLSDLAERLTGERGSWTTLARTNLGTSPVGGGRFVDANLLRAGWCLETPTRSRSATPAPAPPTHGGVRTIAELSILGLGVLATASVARRLGSLAKLTESSRTAGFRFDRPPTPVGESVAAIEPFGDGLLVDWIDAALRICSTAVDTPPDVRLVRAGPAGVELLLATALPSPPRPLSSGDGGRWWILDAAELADPDGLAVGTGRVIPWLVPVGEDRDDVYLIAVGPGRHLVLDGSDEDVASITRGIVSGLRSLPWASELEVELIGIDAPPPTERCFQLFSSSPSTLRHLVTRGPFAQRTSVRPTWRREPLVVANGRPAIDSDLLAEVLECTGVISSEGNGTERLVVEPDGTTRLWPYGVTLRSPRPSVDQSELLDRLFASAAATVALVPKTAVSATSVGTGLPPNTGTPGRTDLALLVGAPSLSGLAAPPAVRDLDRLVELVAYLVLHDYRASIRETAHALFSREDPTTTPSRLQNLLAVARSVLPPTSDASSLLLVAPDDVLTLSSEVTCDWSRFAAAVSAADGADPARAVTCLSYALSLVSSPHLLSDHCPYTWMTSEGMRIAMRADVVDAAHHLATLRLAADDLVGADTALRCGLDIDPISEMLVRDQMVLVDRTGDRTAVTEVFRGLEVALDRLASAEPSTETRALHRTLTEQTA